MAIKKLNDFNPQHFLYTKIMLALLDMSIGFYNTDSDLELADIAVVVAVVIKRRKRKPKRVWVRKPRLEKRSESGVFSSLQIIMCTFSSAVFSTFETRFCCVFFNYALRKITNGIICCFLTEKLKTLNF